MPNLSDTQSNTLGRAEGTRRARRQNLIILGLLFVFVLLLLYILGLFNIGVSRENYEKIQQGMGPTRVQLILGVGRRDGKFVNAAGEETPTKMWSWESLWGRQRISIVFKDERAVSKSFLENDRIIDLTIWEDPFLQPSNGN